MVERQGRYFQRPDRFGGFDPLYKVRASVEIGPFVAVDIVRAHAKKSLAG
jgi:hypothetical protein